MRCTSCTTHLDNLPHGAIFQSIINRPLGVDGTLEAGVQLSQATQLSGLPITGPRGKGAFTGNKLLRKFTLRVDRLIGAGHSSPLA